MTPTVTLLLHPGLPNPRAELRPDQLATIEDVLQDLDRREPLTLLAARISCWPKTSDADLYLFALTGGRLVYVSESVVETIRGLRLDLTGRLLSVAAEALPAGRPLDLPRCAECEPGEELGELWQCPCDGTSLGLDLAEWNYQVVINHNNCYSYARRTRWCVGGQGSQPGNRRPDSEEDILEGLERDGLEPVTERVVLAGEGDAFIALFTNGTEQYHFLRLESNGVWTHQSSGYAAVACDADGRCIAADGVERARIPGYRFKAYYHVGAKVKLTHCSR